MASWETYLKQHKERFLGELLSFVRIPSVSALPDHAADVQQAAQWVDQRMRAAGVENVVVMPTDGHPVVYGDWLHADGGPTILIYGHFDTQPADPLDLWTDPPFEPAVRDGRVYGRGASDDKSMLMPLLAVEALLTTEGALPVNVKFLFEGEEEIGSPHLPTFLATNRNRFACDLVVSADGLQWSEDQPCLVVALKGLVGLQIDVRGAKSDLHSGQHGGGIQNPIHALVRVLDSMRSPDGKIMVDGFYDAVIPISDTDRDQILAVPYDEAEYKSELGVNDVFGEPGYSTRERLWARPTLELNGIWGGFQGEGFKTVIANEAHAKITCRLVADQDPDQIADLINGHVAKHAPPGVKITVHRLAGSSDPYLMPADHSGNLIAANVLQGLFGKAPYYIRLGGSIAAVPLFLKELGRYTVNFGFQLADERLHAPNEFFRLTNFERGQRGYCLLLHQLKQLKAK